MPTRKVPDRAADLLLFAESSAGQGLSHLMEIVQTLFPNYSGPDNAISASNPRRERREFNRGTVDRLAGQMNSSIKTSHNDNTNTQAPTLAEIRALAKDPAKIQEKLSDLRDLIEQARIAGARKADCDYAFAKVEDLASAVRNPDSEDSKEDFSGAVGMLKGIADGFKTYGDIGENFQNTLHLVVPAIGLLLQV